MYRDLHPSYFLHQKRQHVFVYVSHPVPKGVTLTSEIQFLNTLVVPL